MYRTSILPTMTVPQPSLTTALPVSSRTPANGEDFIAHLARRGVFRLESRAAGYVHSIFKAPPHALRVARIARRLCVSRRTLTRHFRAEGLPSAVDWVAVARALYAHRTIVRGGKLRIAAHAAGYPDQFTMSNAIHRSTGLRPSQLRKVRWDALLDVWIAKQRARGAFTGPPSSAVPACPLCGRSTSTEAA